MPQFLFFLYRYNATTGIAPKKILKNAIVRSPYEYVAILILKNAEAHIKDKIVKKKII